MRTWQSHVARQKRRRREHALFIENLQTAESYHRHSLRTKGLLSFIKYRVTSMRGREVQCRLEALVAMNTLRFYIRAWNAKRAEVQWIESGKQIAALFRSKVTMRKSLLGWHSWARTQKTQVTYLRLNLAKRVSAIKVLSQLAAHSVS
jgi:hypothetical protein